VCKITKKKRNAQKNKTQIIVFFLYFLKKYQKVEKIVSIGQKKKSGAVADTTFLDI